MRDVYISIPKQIDVIASNMVWKLENAICNLRESARLWYDLLLRDLIRNGLKPLKPAPFVFLGSCWILVCCVGDILPRNDREKLRELKHRFAIALSANGLSKAREGFIFKGLQWGDYKGLLGSRK